MEVCIQKGVRNEGQGRQAISQKTQQAGAGAGPEQGTLARKADQEKPTRMGALSLRPEIPRSEQAAL